MTWFNFLLHLSSNTICNCFEHVSSRAFLSGCFVHFFLFPLYCTDPHEGILDENDFFFSSSLYNKPYCSYHCTALMFGIAAAHGWTGKDWVSPALSATTWPCFHTLIKEHNSRMLFPPFITWGLQKSICLCSRNDFPNWKDTLSGALEAEKIWVFWVQLR